MFRHSCLDFLPVPDEVGPYFRVFDSFKDLLLCGFWGAGFPEGEGVGRFYFVCNPFTKQWIALPLAPERSSGILMRLTPRLVCEPAHSIRLDLGDGRGAQFDYSSYRFRVVFRCQMTDGDEGLDVFCSESGEWIEETLVLKTTVFKRVVSCNGKLFFYKEPQFGFKSPLALDVFNPFRLDVHPRRVCTSIPGGAASIPRQAVYEISVLQDALHMVLLESEFFDCSRNALSVWRLVEEDDDEYSWRKLHEVFLKNTTLVLRGCNYELERLFRVYLHPQRLEIVFLNYLDSRNKDADVLSMDLGTGEVEFFGAHYCPYWKPFQPKVSCWPTPIPRYEELRGTYDGSYNRLLKIKKSTAEIPPWLNW
ncbi:unnamed protein product [Linum tenue]|nr:unnamed protein product [Linum tenue]